MTGCAHCGEALERGCRRCTFCHARLRRPEARKSLKRSVLSRGLERPRRVLLRGLQEAVRNDNLFTVHILLLAIALWLQPIGGGVVQTYYVRTTGNDANPGTTGSPKRTIAAALALLLSGDRLFIGAGVYAEAIAYNAVPSGLDDFNHTIIQAETDGTVTLNGTNAVFGDVLTIYNGSYITIRGLILDKVGGAAPVARFTGDAGGGFSHHILFEDCEAKNASGGTSAAITQSNVGGQTHHLTFRRLEVHDCTGGAPTGTHGIYLTAADSVIEDCEVYACDGHGIHVYYGGGTGVDRAIVRRNRVHHNGSFGIMLSSGQGSLAYDNLVYRNVYGMRLFDGARDCQLLSNTVVGNTGALPAIWIQSGSGGIVRNNSLSGNTQNAILDDGFGSSVDHNVTDPAFIDSAGNDFRLASGSSGETSGMNLSSLFSTDFNQSVRTSPWSIGAYISGAPVVVTPGVVVPPVVTIPPPIDTPSGIYTPPPVITPGGSAFIARGGRAPYTFAITSGALPAGLTLNANGTITGTPTVSGTFTFTVEVTDSDGQTDSKSCQIVIQPATPALSYDSLFAFEMLDYGLTSAIAASGFPYPFVLSTLRLDAADFDGDLWYFEIVATNNHASISYNVLLIDGAGATKATIAVPANVTAPTIYRSASFALTAAESDYQVKMPATAVNANVWVRVARMLVQLTSATKAVSAFPLTMSSNVSGTNAEGSIVGIGATARFDASPIDAETSPQNFSIFRFTASHWSMIAEYKLQLVYQTNGASQALVFGLFDVSTGIEVSGSHIAVPTTALPKPEFLTLTIPAGALTDGHEYELRGSEPGIETCYLYKARLHVKLTALQAAEAYLMVSKETGILNTVSPEARQTFGSTLYGTSRSMFLEAVGSVSGSAGLFHGDLIDDGANLSGTAGAAVSGGSVSFTTTKARVRSSALPLADAHYTWKETRTSGGDSMTTTIAFILVVVEWS